MLKVNISPHSRILQFLKTFSPLKGIRGWELLLLWLWELRGWFEVMLAFRDCRPHASPEEIRTTSPLPQGNERGEQMDDGSSEAERGSELEESSE
jgi:hypothetical protein